jgi:hypothetical protein
MDLDKRLLSHIIDSFTSYASMALMHTLLDKAMIVIIQELVT